MDGVSVAASVVGIATAGVQISIKLVTLATQISTASDRVSAIGNDISLTSGVLHQLGELMTQKTTDDGVSIFSEGGLESTRLSAAVCERIFRQVETEAKKASEQLRDCKQGRLTGGKIKLSRAERAKWPFLQPSVDTLRADLREAKGTLMLMLQVTSLALSKRMADLNEATSSSMSEQRDFIRAIVALQQQQQQQQQGQRLELRGSNPNGVLPGQQKVTDPISSPNPGTADRTPSMDVARSIETPPIPVNASQTQASLASLYEPTKLATTMSTGQDMTVKLPTISPTLSGQDRSRDMRTCSAPRGSFEASKAPSHTIDNENNHQRTGGLPLVRRTARSKSEHHGRELLNLFLLKPIVKDFFDRVELSWPVRNSKMQPLAIRKYMANHEQEGLPSVIEMLHDLHAYEQAMVDLEVSKYPEGSILSLRRTHTDIRHRDMIFKDIPGLQFVVQHVIRSFRTPEPASRYFVAPGGQLANNRAKIPAIIDQTIVSPIVGCQVCGTNVSPILGEGGRLICNACGHHSWRQQRLEAQQQQQNQSAIKSAQQQAQQQPQSYMRRSTLQQTGRPGMIASPLLKTSALNYAAAAAAQQQQMQIQQQQQMQMQQQARAALPQQQQQQQMQMQSYAQMAPQQQQQMMQISNRPAQMSPQQQQEMQPQQHSYPALQHHRMHEREEQQREQQQYQPHFMAAIVSTPEAAPPGPPLYFQSYERYGQPINSQLFTQDSAPARSEAAPPAPTSYFQSYGPYARGIPLQPFPQENALARSEAAPPGPMSAFPPWGAGLRQAASQPFTEHDALSPPSKRPRLTAGNSVEDKEAQVATVSALPLSGSTWQGISSGKMLGFPGNASEEGESDVDGRREGDDVDVDAIVKNLLGKYTTLFDY